MTAPKIEGVNARERVATNATTQFSRDMVQNQETIANRVIFSSQKYQNEMNQAIDKQAGAQIAGVNAGAGQAISGYQRGAAQARGGVEQNYQAELGANKAVYVSQVDAAGQIQSAGLEAAQLRQAAAVIAAVGREISREVGQGMHYTSNYYVLEKPFAIPEIYSNTLRRVPRCAQVSSQFETHLY